MAVHHFNVPVAPDVSDRFMVLHYTDWESLNGRNINNWVRAEATPCAAFVTTGRQGWILYGRMLMHTLHTLHSMKCMQCMHHTLDTLDSYTFGSTRSRWMLAWKLLWIKSQRDE